MVQIGWDVYIINGEYLDTVFFDPDMNAEDVYHSLVEHDGYRPDIRIYRS